MPKAAMQSAGNPEMDELAEKARTKLKKALNTIWLITTPKKIPAVFRRGFFVLS